MATYTLIFDATGNTHEEFNVPAGKVVYLARSPAAASGTATVHDLLTLEDYVIPDGVTVCQTAIAEGDNVSLAFMARSNQNINSVNAEVIRQRLNIPNCQ